MRRRIDIGYSLLHSRSHRIARSRWLRRPHRVRAPLLTHAQRFVRAAVAKVATTAAVVDAVERRVDERAHRVVLAHFQARATLKQNKKLIFNSIRKCLCCVIEP